MSLWKKLFGTQETYFQFGLRGPKAKKNSSSVLDIRNAGNTDYAQISIKDPTSDEHGATKKYVDDNEKTGAIRTIQINVTTATVFSIKPIPANAIILDTKVKVKAAYDNGATMTIGHDVSPNILQDTTDNDLATLGTYDVEDITENWGAAAKAVKVTIGNVPTVGSSVVLVQYAEPDM